MRGMTLSKGIKCVRLTLAIAMVCLATASLPAAGADADTTQPHEFYGNITINGLAAPVGTVIVARIGDVERGRFTTTEIGGYGGSGTFDQRLIVSGEESEVGQMITFWMNGEQANQTVEYEPGQSTNLDLSSNTYPLNPGDIQITRAFNYLRGEQQADGRIAAFATSAWAVMAIAAAGEDPNTWTAGGPSIVDYLRDHASQLDTNKATDWERSVLAIVAAGKNPRDFGGIDYVSTVLGLYDGTQIGDNTLLNDDFWGILALTAIGENQGIQNSKNFVISNQNSDGGWGWAVGGNSDADNTAAAISALIAAGESPSSQAISQALGYLQSQQQNDGGFVSEGTTNAAVDSWVINSIIDAGQSPLSDDWRKSGNNPISHLLSLQDADGAFKWTAGMRSNPEWMMTYAIIALLGKSWPKDETPPTIPNLSPSPGGTVTTATPLIYAAYADATSGIDASTVALLVDNVNVTINATVTASDIRYAPSSLSYGTHTVKITVKDRCGNTAQQTWSFQRTSSSRGGGGRGSQGSESAAGTTNVSDIVTNNGIFTQETTAESEDGKCVLDIAEDTRGLTKDGDALEEITVVEMEDPPAPPAKSNVIGLVYDLGPDGATFDPPTDLTFSYDELLLPAGVTEENLVVAIWDEEADTWEELPCTVNPETNKITAQASHFTAFTVLVGTSPAAFIVSDISISPTEVEIGEGVTVTVLITNTGDLTGTYQVTLKINDAAVETKEVTLIGGASEIVDFNITKDTPGTYAVNIDALSGTFKVRAPAPAGFSTSALTISPAEVRIGESITISVLITNSGDLAGRYNAVLKINDIPVETKEVILKGDASQRLTFTIAKDIPGKYTVNINGLSGTFEVRPLKAPVSFSFSNLSISPAEVSIGESVTISISVANNGDLSGAHEVGLKINGAIVETREINLASGDIEEVSFRVTKNTIGTYAVDIGGLSGSFVVKEAAPQPSTRQTYWPIIAGVMVGVVVVVLVVFFVIRRRSYY